jgi:hypothetical protein
MFHSFISSRLRRLFFSTTLMMMGCLFVAVSQVQAAAVTVNCSGTAGTPTVVDEASLASDDVTFSDTGGDGYCELDASISSNAVVIEDGVVLTHVAADSDGVTITTVGDFTISASATLNVDAKGCASSQSPNGSNVCSDNGTSAGSGEGQKAGGGSGGGGGGHAGSGGAGELGELGGSKYGVATAPVFFGSGGGEDADGNQGAGAGGLIILNVGGVLNHQGTITADGDDSTGCGNNSRACGGPSGGSINIIAGTMSGTGSFSADGGNGENDTYADGGGGSGGRIAIKYTAATYSFDSSDFSVAAGTGSDSATSGSVGSVYVEDTDDNAVQIYYGFTYAGDYSETSWIVDASAAGQNCTTDDVTPSVTAATLTLGGTLTCSEALTSFNWTSTSAFSVASGTSISLTNTGITTDFDLVAGDDQTWTNFSFTGGPEGFFTIDDAVDISLAGTSTVTANAQWTNLTALTVNGTSTMSSSGLGCGSSESPNGSNACSDNGTSAGSGEGQKASAGSGGGGGGYGGAGGDGELGESGGSTYGVSAAPVLFGSGGGESSSDEHSTARAGGLIRLDVDGTASISGTISSDGEDSNDCSGTNSRACGGPSGGSLYVTATTIAGSGATITATGGNGQDDAFADGGGGGGGRVSIVYSTNSSDYVATLVASTIAAGGAGTGTATAGSSGTYNNEDLGPSMTTASTNDADNDGQIDQIIVNFTEGLDAGTIASGDFSISDSYVIGSVAVTASAQVTITLTESGSSDTSVVPTVTIVGSIDDSGGASTTSGSKVSTDAASPVVVSISPTDGAIDQLVGVSVAITFSEAMNTGSLAYTLSEIPTDLATAWTVGNTVLTYTTTEGYAAGSTVTLSLDTLSGADARSLNTAPSLVGGNNSFSFTLLAASGGSVTATVTILSPNGGEFLIGGTIYEIDWTWSGGTNNARTQLYYSVDSGGYELIEDYYNGSASEYTWEVPDVVSEDVLLKIVRSGVGYATEDYSNATFSIQSEDVDDGDVATSTEESLTEEIVEELSGEFSLPSESQSPFSGEIESVDQDISAGDLIVGDSYSTVYYINVDGERQPFFNDATFFTHFDSFENVRGVSDATLGVLSLGTPMLPRSQSVLVKLQSDPRVYAIEESGSGETALRWVPSEEVAHSLYGDGWAEYVLDLPVFLFPRFVQGDEMSVMEVVDVEEMKERSKLNARAKIKHAI